MDAMTLALSPEMEDYLETIAALFRANGEARVTDIAERLSVSKAGVTQALRSLAAKGLVDYRPYVSPTLTATGQHIAERVQRRHDVLKRFLAEVLLVDAELAEANACRLEHAVDRSVLERLAHFMDFVQRCPRGGSKWIRGYEHSCDPEKETGICERCLQMAIDDYRNRQQTQATEEKTMTLAELKPGESGRIVRVGSVGSIRRRIVDMGAVNGTNVTVVKVAPLGDPIEVKIKGYSLTLRKEEAEAITIEAQIDQEGAK
ncbi:MAG: DtxR family transcriptional regulator [Lentisphaeria bacterium]|jgi:DtxR family Mn-dependent transcriptional regulator